MLINMNGGRIMRMFVKLFLSFAYIGTFTFGGGYSMLPMFRRELADKRGWVSEGEVADMFAAAQCLPGIIACNTAMFVGYKQKGIIGGIAAALGVIFPSIVIILIIAIFLSGITDNRLVINALAGVRVCVCVLILNSVIKLWKQSVADKLAIFVFAAVFFVSVFTSLPVAVIVAAAGAFGIAVSAARRRNDGIAP